MRPSATPFALALIVAVAALAGCVEQPTDYHASGSNGHFAVGWAYDGEASLPFEGFIMIHVDPAANTGTATVEGFLNGQPWLIEFDHFAEQAGKAFQDGGIAQDLDEHGDTGVADTSIPKVHVDTAAWGDALVTVQDVPVLDPLTDDERWLAHFMVVTTGVRDDETQAIHTADGQGIYDPANPSDGLATDGDHEVHLVLKSHAAAPANATAVSNESAPSTGSVGGGHGYTTLYRNSVFNVTLSIEGTFAPMQQVTFILYAPGGERVSTVQLNDDRRQAPMVAVLEEKGKYQLSVQGSGIAASYSIDGSIMPPDNVVMNLWWEDVLFGEAAESFEATASPGPVEMTASGDTTVSAR